MNRTELAAVWPPTANIAAAAGRTPSLPHKLTKRLPHKLAKLRLPDLLKHDLSKYELRNAQTINKSLNLLSGIVAKADKNGNFEGFPAGPILFA